MNSITAIILTFNESLHLQRCIDSILPLTSNIVVVDSLSTDDTVQIAKRNNVRVLERAWENNHSVQFNWAIDQLSNELHWNDSQWIFRIDADEVLTPALVKQIQVTMPKLPSSVNGIDCHRHLIFQGKLLRFGGMSKNRVLRLFRFGHGYSESRWMDEHIVVKGDVQKLPGAIVDENLHPMSWWITKHNNYASRAAVDALKRGRRNQSDEGVVINEPSSLGWSMRLKEVIYALLPRGYRGITFYVYRYFFRLGFLDGPSGATFYFMQTWWYRNLIDAKVAEVERYMRTHSASLEEAIFAVLDINVMDNNRE